MKEYRCKEGGRYIFNEDLQNVQELALSMTEMFKDCGKNFVISGCGITITDVTPSSSDLTTYSVEVAAGYAFINNKVRKVNATSFTTSVISTIRIYESDSVGPDIMYADGSTDKQYNDYGAVVVLNETRSGAQDIIATKSADVWSFPNAKTVYFNYYLNTKLISVNELDGLFSMTKQELLNLCKNDAPIYYCITATYNGGTYLVGRASIYTDNALHQLTLEITSNYLLSGSDNISTSAHRDGQMFTFYRTYGFTTRQGIEDGVWNDWLEAHPDYLSVLLTKNGGSLYDGCGLKVTTGEQGGEESYVEIAPGGLEIQQNDSDNRVVITGRKVEAQNGSVIATNIQGAVLKDGDGNEVSISTIIDYFNSLEPGT